LEHSLDFFLLLFFYHESFFLSPGKEEIPVPTCPCFSSFYSSPLASKFLNGQLFAFVFFYFWGSFSTVVSFIPLCYKRWAVPRNSVFFFPLFFFFPPPLCYQAWIFLMPFRLLLFMVIFFYLSFFFLSFPLSFGPSHFLCDG